MITCCAVVSPSNTPLYLSALGPEGEAHRHQAAVHSALDALEEKMAAGFRSAPGEAPACYLGLLTPSDGFRVYGYGTNTKARLLLAMEGGTMREEEVQAAFRQLHAAYVDAVSNPFYVAGSPIVSKRFESTVQRLAATPSVPG